jgi:hypothetical protein
MTYTVIFSDGNYNYVDSDSPQGAYKKASDQAIGRYIKKIKCYNYGDIFYDVAKGGFIDHEKRNLEVLDESLEKEVKDGTLIKTIIGRGIYIGEIHEIHIGGKYYNFRLTEGDEGFTMDIYIRGRSDKPIKTLNLKMELILSKEPEGSLHEFDAAYNCTKCNISIFDMDNPEDPCEG